MPILADQHLHSHFSADTDASMRDMIEAGIKAGLNTMCFTEHNDFEMPPLPGYPPESWVLNTDSYLYELLGFKEEYSDRIKLLFGVEIGFQEKCMRQDAVYAKSHEFDFIIGSSHIIRDLDPYYPEFFEGRDVEDAYHEYFETELLNIKKHSNFDVYGHLDYVVRYGGDPTSPYDYAKHAEVFDEILKTLIAKEKGIELNTGGIDKGMKEFHPCEKVLRRYKELGGEIITIGSDAHSAENVACHFDKAADMLKACGFDYYCVFENRSPEFFKI